jgi:hypothetical protein
MCEKETPKPTCTCNCLQGRHNGWQGSRNVGGAVLAEHTPRGRNDGMTSFLDTHYSPILVYEVHIYLHLRPGFRIAILR